MSQNVLTLFPARAAIGKWRDPNTGRDIPVHMTTEFERALAGLFVRVGGDIAMPNDDLETTLAMQPIETGALQMVQQIGDLQREVAQLRWQLAAAAETAKRVEQLERLLSTPGATAELAKRVESAERVERSGAQAAQAETSKRVAALEQTERASLAAALAETKKRLDDLERLTAQAQKPTDWDHPGALGFRAPNTASFTSVTISSVLTSTQATGTAPFTVASTTKVANLNADLLDGADWAAPAALGSTTPNSAACTTISATGQITSTLPDGGLPPFSVLSFVNVPRLNCSLLLGFNWATPGTIGSTTPNTGRFTTLTSSGGAQLIGTSANLNNGAGAGAGTLTNAPAAGNPTKWIPINDNGTTRYVPAW